MNENFEKQIKNPEKIFKSPEWLKKGFKTLSIVAALVFGTSQASGEMISMELIQQNKKVNSEWEEYSKLKGEIEEMLKECAEGNCSTELRKKIDTYQSLLDSQWVKIQPDIMELNRMKSSVELQAHELNALITGGSAVSTDNYNPEEIVLDQAEVEKIKNEDRERELLFLQKINGDKWGPLEKEILNQAKATEEDNVTNNSKIENLSDGYYEVTVLEFNKKKKLILNKDFIKDFEKVKGVNILSIEQEWPQNHKNPYDIPEPNIYDHAYGETRPGNGNTDPGHSSRH